VAAQQQLAEERQRKREQAAEDAKGVEVVKNGAIRERYRWTQELPELTVSIELPPGTAKKDVVCKIGPERLAAGVRGLPPLVDGQLHARVRADEAMWQLQDSHRLVVTLPKLALEKHVWWPCLLQGEAEIDVDACEAGESTNLLSTTGSRLRMEKIELPESKGKKFATKEEAERAWKQFFTDFPGMRAYEISFDSTDGGKSGEEQLKKVLEPMLAKSEGEWEKGTE
tara:strand:- start:30 stop:707 length:678 start_codon:yes stop_codon:yes gene_type:complete